MKCIRCYEIMSGFMEIAWTAWIKLDREAIENATLATANFIDDDGGVGQINASTRDHREDAKCDGRIAYAWCQFEFSDPHLNTFMQHSCITFVDCVDFRDGRNEIEPKWGMPSEWHLNGSPSQRHLHAKWPIARENFQSNRCVRTGV